MTPQTPRTRQIFATPGFRRLFAAAAASKSGVVVGNLALPLVAVLALEADAGQAGLLATCTTLAFLLIGLPSGVWVDRLRKRPVMIAADLVRAVLLAWVPLAWWLGRLTIGQLYVVALLTGAATVFFDVAAQSFLPRVVGRDRLLAANSVLHGFDAGATVAGPAAAGGLIAWVTAPFAVVVNAVGYLVSALLLTGLEQTEPKGAADAPRGRTAAGVAEGVRFVTRHPVLRPIALQGALANLGIKTVTVILPFLLARELRLSEAVIGLSLACGGVGVFLGAAAARPLADRMGAGRTLWALGLAIAPFALVTPFVADGVMLWVSGAAWAAVMFKTGVDNVLLVSFRQLSTPDHMLGRMNATFRTVLTGALTVGAALAGLLGQLAGTRAALWVGSIALASVWVPVCCSPIRTMRDLPDMASVGRR